MIARLHFATSLVLSYLIYFFIADLDKISSVILSIITAKLSTIPDLDYKIYSWANKQILFLKKSKFYILIIPYYLFLEFLIRIFKHRGITHTIYPILFFIFLRFLFFNLFFVLTLAFVLHLLEDSITISGIRPFYPLSNLEIKIPILSNKNRFIQDKLSILLLIIFFVIVLA